MSVVKRVLGLPVQIGGEPHPGWLPVGAAHPLPTSVRAILMDVAIEFDGYGYLLCYQARDGSISGDTWHKILAEAEQAAANSLGVQPCH